VRMIIKVKNINGTYRPVVFFQLDDHPHLFGLEDIVPGIFEVLLQNVS